MLAAELQKIYSQLAHETPVQVRVDGFDILVRVLDNTSKLSLITPVYFGGNFIPKSVRKCLSEKASFTRDHVSTFFSIDEEHFTIYLHYLGGLESVYSTRLGFLLDEFSYLANEWRLYLDEHDRNDLIHVRVK